MSGTATAFSVGLHCCHWTRVPALGTPNADSGTLAHLVGPQQKWMPSPVLLMSGLVGSILGSKVRSKFADHQETKEPKGKGCPDHQTIVFFKGSGSNLCCI